MKKENVDKVRMHESSIEVECNRCATALWRHSHTHTHTLWTRRFILQAYLAAKAKRQLVVDEHNDGDSEVGEVHDMNVDDQDPVFEFAYDDKIDERSIELINFEDEAIDSPVRTHHKSTATLQLHTANKELLEMQKTLLEREYNDLYAFRLERHQLEMSILKAELAHKTMEHQKRMDILNKKLQHT